MWLQIQGHLPVPYWQSHPISVGYQQSPITLHHNVNSWSYALVHEPYREQLWWAGGLLAASLDGATQSGRENWRGAVSVAPQGCPSSPEPSPSFHLTYCLHMESIHHSQSVQRPPGEVPQPPSWDPNGPHTYAGFLHIQLAGLPSAPGSATRSLLESIL